jgi:hypothetical protein
MGLIGKNTENYGAVETSYDSAESSLWVRESNNESLMSAFADDDERRQAIKACFAQLVILTILSCIAFFCLSSSEGAMRSNAEKGVWMIGNSSTAVTVGPLHFEQQLDHFGERNHNTWLNTYFTSNDFFGGPGHPILVIMGGEGPVEDILYPFVSNRLAREFSAYVLQTEHRFYGSSKPVGDHPTSGDFKAYLAPEQAMADYIQLILHVQDQLGCSADKSSFEYCPIITIGGSYPGFLSAMMRLVHPDVVDISYASSAPLMLYEHFPDFDTNGYFDKVAQVADMAVPGCVEATYKTSKELNEWVLDEEASGALSEIAGQLGICVDSLPSYLHTLSRVDLGAELTILLVTSNADLNMQYYPPSKGAGLVQACGIMMEDSTKTTATQRYAKFLTWKRKFGVEPSKWDCFDLSSEIPNGPNASLSTADWSGTGGGPVGEAWEFQICRDLVAQTGFAGSEKMFYPPRPWKLDWLSQHCQARFGVLPQPHRLIDMWHFDKLVSETSHILFTNGLVDGWSASSYLHDLSDTIVALNFPNGAHHSDLGHKWPRPDDTPDIIEGHNQITKILGEWLAQM